MGTEPRADGGVFVSYRRADTSGYAERLFESLEARFGPKRVFLDTGSIAPGTEFPAEIRQRVAGCDVLLTVIGPQWLSLKDQYGERRIDDADDWVRLEIQIALELNTPVIPVLVNGARMPAQQDLPEGIRSLANREAIVISRHWHPDVEELIGAIERFMPAGSRRQDLRRSITARYERQTRDRPTDVQRNVLGLFVDGHGSFTPPDVKESERPEPEPLWDLLQRATGEGEPCILLGNFGQGKSWHLQMLEYRLAKGMATAPWNGPEAPDPVFLDLRQFRRNTVGGGLAMLLPFLAGGREESVFSQVRRRAWSLAYGESAARSSDEAMLADFESGRQLLLLDGLDEMRREDASVLLSEIGQLSRATRRSPVIVSCRRTFFRDSAEEKRLSQLGLRPVYLWPWDRNQLQRYLQKAHAVGIIHSSASEAMSALLRLYGLADIATRAMLAAMLVSQWDHIDTTTPLSIPTLYEEYIERALLNWQASRTWSLSLAQLREYMEEVAFLMFRLDRRALNNEELNEYFGDALRRHGIPRFSDLAASVAEDLHTNSFLLRYGDEYVFCHESLADFLVARRLLRAAKTRDVDAFSVLNRSREYRSVIETFLVPMLSDGGDPTLLDGLFSPR